jgi:DNA-binding NtrC family response regulator
VRVVAATHRNLEEEVRQGRFREDLYYRLRVVEIELPPLRERLADVPALALRFLEQVNERLGREKQRLSEAALAQLARQRWPGNVRELRNAIEQASVLASSPLIDAADFQHGGAARAPAEEAGAPADTATAHFAEAKRRAVEGFEREFLLRALRAHGGNISRAAESIGMVRQSLQQKIRELDLRSEDWSDGDE